MVAWWLAPHSDYGTRVTGWLIGVGLALFAFVVYLWFAWWVSMLLQRARREQTRADRRDL